MTLENAKLEPLGGGFYAVTSPDHTFGSDALLLADFASPRGARRCCDLCAGCGIISVLWLAESSERAVDAVEVQSEAVSLVRLAAEYNGFSNLRAVEADLRELDASFTGSYDLVACNPPYKQAGSGKVSASPAALAARHETLCTLEDAVTAGARLLKNGGRLCLCHRPERLTDILTLMRRKEVEPKRLRLVQQREAARPWLALVEGKKGAKPGLCVEPTLFVEDVGGGYSHEMSGIYNKLDRRS